MLPSIPSYDLLLRLVVYIGRIVGEGTCVRGGLASREKMYI
jgi:hypothetical protein